MEKGIFDGSVCFRKTAAGRYPDHTACVMAGNRVKKESEREKLAEKADGKGGKLKETEQADEERKSLWCASECVEIVTD